jgi:hypothetical protein
MSGFTDIKTDVTLKDDSTTIHGSSLIRVANLQTVLIRIQFLPRVIKSIKLAELIWQQWVTGETTRMKKSS